MEIMQKITLSFDPAEFQSLVETLVVAYESNELSLQGDAFVERLLIALNVPIENEEESPPEPLKH